MLPSALPPQSACGNQRVSLGTNLWRTWHQLQLKVRSEDMQVSQLRCCRQAAREKAVVPWIQALHRPPRGATFLNAEALLSHAVSD